MKKIFALLFIFVLAVPGAFSQEAAEYFNEFCSSYLLSRKIPKENRETTNLLFDISKAKIRALENFLNSANSKDEIKEALSLINEEYNDLLENLNFEASFWSPPMNKRCEKKFKKAHKKFMRFLEKCYLEG